MGLVEQLSLKYCLIEDDDDYDDDDDANGNDVYWHFTFAKFQQIQYQLIYGYLLCELNTPKRHLV